MVRRLFQVLFVLAASGAWMTATPALSEQKFDINGVYGDEHGCKKETGKINVGDRGVYITSKKYAGHEWQCKFVWAHGEPGENIGAYHGSMGWSVITLCAGEGEVYSRLLSIQQNRDTVTIRDGSNEAVILNRCK